MSTETDVYKIEIRDAVASLNKIEDSFKVIADESKKSGETQTKSFFKAGAALEIAKRAYTEFVNVMKDSVGAYLEQEKADKMLARVAGENTEAFKRQAAAMQAALGVSDDMVQGLQTMALTFGAAPDQVQK